MFVKLRRSAMLDRACCAASLFVARWDRSRFAPTRSLSFGARVTGHTTSFGFIPRRLLVALVLNAELNGVLGGGVVGNGGNLVDFGLRSNNALGGWGRRCYAARCDLLVSNGMPW